MKINLSSKWYAIPGTLIVAGCIAAASTLLVAVPAMAETTVFGQSNTILRMGQSIGKKDLYPAYEYLHLSVVNDTKEGGATSFHIGGWGRADLGDKSARDRDTDGDIQYGYVSYQGAKNNLLINAGRQFVTEGVSTERIDGLYARNDFIAGFGLAAYVGSPVITEPNFKADTFIFGSRVTQSMSKFYTLGLSAMRSFSDNGPVFREQEGVDLWVHPVKQIDVTGRSSYNSVTNGWMEHAYALTIIPLDNLWLGGDYSYTNYQDFFQGVTTSALSYLNGDIDRRERVRAFGANVSYAPIKNLTIAADYRNYNYEIAKDADYFGGRATYSMPESFAAGFAIHRMDGKTDKLKYTEYRVFASKKISHLDLALDFINLNYDSRMNGVNNAFEIKGSASYEITHGLKVGADIDYGKNPDFDNEVKGLIKLTYAFDTKRAAEGRAKSEK